MTTSSLVLREVRLPNASGPRIGDVLVRNGVFEAVGRVPSAPGDAVEVDGRGCWLLPGAVDMHVHLRDPGWTHKEDLGSGTRAAVAGGVTTVCDMPNTRPPTQGREELQTKARRARQVAHCEVLFYLALGRDNLDAIASCLGDPNFAGVKVFLGATTGDLLSEEDTLLRAVDQLPCLFVFHAEDEEVLRRARQGIPPSASAADHHRLRPAEAVEVGARRVASLWRPGRRLHLCHLSSAQELQVLRNCPDLTAEVAPHHLWFTWQDTARLGNLLKVNPPVREASDREALRAALVDGRIPVLATDHAPHTLEEKALPYREAPSGIPGLETLVPSTLRLVQQGLFPLERAVEAFSTIPARILGLHDRGAIAPGLRADCFLWDPEGDWVPGRGQFRSRCPWSPFEGIPLSRRPLATWVAGTLVHLEPRFGERAGITVPAD